jgi:RNA polymerase I-specific transcription initiation factor RRN3
LVTAQSTFVNLVLRMIVSLFNHRPYLRNHLDLDHVDNKDAKAITLSGYQQHENATKLTRSTIYERAHRALRHITKLIPAAAMSLLSSYLVDAFPHKREREIAQTTYLRNILCVCEYAPMLKDQIWMTIVERVVQIDVDVQDVLDEDSDASTPIKKKHRFGTTDHMFLLDMSEHEDEPTSESGTDSNWEEEEGQKKQARATEKQTKKLQKTMSKLDAMLDILLTFLHSKQASLDSPRLPATPSIDPPDSMADYFYMLLEMYEKLILPTHETRFTQFLLFYAASWSAEFTEAFLGYLLDVTTKQQTMANHLRVAAAGYVGSFVARARFVDKDTLQMVLKMLLGWARLQWEDYESTERRVFNMHEWRVWYAALQAVMYTFCFRWKELVTVDDASEEKEWWQPLSILSRLVLCRLNPLRVVSPIVAKQFAHQAHESGFMYCYTLLGENQRTMIGEQLDAHFPFDPCQLQDTALHIDPLYRTWESVHGTIHEEEDDEDEQDSFMERMVALSVSPKPLMAESSLLYKK